jgi:hypothetical protein
MLLIEELAARGWPAAETFRRDGWLLRHTPSLTRRRSNSALALGDDNGDPALVEEFYARRGARALVQVAPAEQRTGLDAELAARGWTREGPTDVLVADAGAALAATRPGEVALADRPDAGWIAAWAACEQRPDADEHARVVLARIEPATAVRPGGRRPRRRARGVRARLGGPVLRRHGRERAPARHRGPRRPRADGLGRRTRRAAPLSPGRERQRASPCPVRARGLHALTRLSLQGGPAVKGGV